MIDVDLVGRVIDQSMVLKYLGLPPLNTAWGYMKIFSLSTFVGAIIERLFIQQGVIVKVQLSHRV